VVVAASRRRQEPPVKKPALTDVGSAMVQTKAGNSAFQVHLTNFDVNDRLESTHE
jgi:hypothetical protein